MGWSAELVVGERALLAWLLELFGRVVNQFVDWQIEDRLVLFLYLVGSC